MLDVVPGLLEPPVQLQGEVLVEQDPHAGARSRDLTDRRRQVSSNVTRIPNCGEHLLTAQLVRLLHGRDALAGTDRANHGGHVHPCPGDARLPKRTLRSIVIPG